MRCAVEEDEDMVWDRAGSWGVMARLSARVGEGDA